MYRIYCNGIEFGMDFATLAEAREVKASYQSYFPKLNYYIRLIRRPRGVAK